MSDVSNGHFEIERERRMLVMSIIILALNEGTNPELLDLNLSCQPFESTAPLDQEEAV